MFTKIDLRDVLPDETHLLGPYVEYMALHGMRIRLEACMTPSGVGHIVHVMGRDGVERALPHPMPHDERVPDVLRPAAALRFAQSMLQVMLDTIMADGGAMSDRDLYAMIVGQLPLRQALVGALGDRATLYEFLENVGMAQDFVWLSRVDRGRPPARA